MIENQYLITYAFAGNIAEAVQLSRDIKAQLQQKQLYNKGGISMFKKLSIQILYAWLLAAIVFSSQAYAENLKPYILAKTTGGSLSAVVDETKTALQNQGFTIAGEYSPYESAQVIVVTNDELKAAATKSENGGFGAAISVSVTRVGDSNQVSYANPPYQAAAYRMEGDLAGVAASLETALGKQQSFGSKEGLSEKDLRKYHYMFGMPYFDEPDEIASFDSHAAAVEAMESGLRAGKEGTTLVYRIDIPGKEETLLGVGFAEGYGADNTVMSTIDSGELKHTPHLPYEVLISGKDVLSLPGKFRIAISFPDLGMGNFMEISNAPGAIKYFLQKVAGTK